MDVPGLKSMRPVTAVTRTPMRRGSVQHLAFLTEHEQMVYRTALVLNRRWVIEHAG